MLFSCLSKFMGVYFLLKRYKRRNYRLLELFPIN
jgi:hypothetical protein